MIGPALVVGIGSQSGATADDICAAIANAEHTAGVACDCVAALARGSADEAVCQAAQICGRELRWMAVADLVARSGDCVTRSAASLAAHGVASIAEAAALAAAGPGSRLIVPRLKHARVTAAVAASADWRRESALP